MIYLIIKSYLTIFLSVGFGSLACITLGLYFIFKKPRKKTTELAEISIETTAVEMPQNLEAIAGDDLLATQLDLARAYIETGRKQLAKTILESVNHQGSPHQQQEAQQLLATL